MIRLLIICISILLFSCEKVDVPKGTPSYVKREIRKMKDFDPPLIYVLRYSYDSKSEGYLFYYDPTIYYNTYYILNDKCEKVCVSNSVFMPCSYYDLYDDQTPTKIDTIWKKE